MKRLLSSVPLNSEHDVVAVRQRARDIAARLGFDAQDQTRIATASSEIARNTVTYATGGKVEYLIESLAETPALTVHVSDTGPGIKDLKRILQGGYRSKTGMGLGILGARRLMDDFEIESTPAGTNAWLRKRIPARAGSLAPDRLSRMCDELSRVPPRDALDELRHENQELLHTMEEVRGRQEELNRLSVELEETNRGVVALTKELEDSAAALRQASETKSRFLSYMSHEFRTPLTSIMALSRLLMSQADGPLTGEQQKQVVFIRKSAETLLEIVSDLLDISKVEAGRTEVRPERFTVTDLFGTLRGMMKPLQANDAVSLVFEDSASLPSLYTDQAKVAQILRNFISNGLKFTAKGEVRVQARAGPDAAALVFTVTDTGVGIPAEHHGRVFQEFTQIENPLQKSVKGTGLGLSLSRKLAELLGGAVGFESQAGVGSTFWARVPVVYRAPGEAPPAVDAAPIRGKILIIDDEEISRYLIRQSLSLPEDLVIEARNGAEGLARARRELPVAVFLDLRMPDLEGDNVLDLLKRDPATRAIPIVVVTSKHLTPELKSKLAGAAAVLSKDVLTRPDAGDVMRGALARAGVLVENLTLQH